jgi:predicted nucleotidyltransferase
MDTKTSNVLDIVRGFVDKIEDKYAVREAYLFGSRAYGEPTTESDIDLGIVLDKDDVAFDAEKIFIEGQLFDSRLEVFAFSGEAFDKESASLVREVKKGMRVRG